MGVIECGWIDILVSVAPKVPCRVYLVGGAVRDHLLKKQTRDYDFVVFGDLDTLAELFYERCGCRYVKHTKKLATYRFFCDGSVIDLTQNRAPSIEEDLKRRDFTMNSIAYDPVKDELIDPLNGIADIEKKIVRATGESVFRDDPLRILRAFRLAAMYRFDIETGTLKMAQRDSKLLHGVSSERVTEELRLFFLLNNTFTYLLLMDKAGVIDSLFEDLSYTNGCIQSEQHLYDVKTHSLNVYNYIEWSLNRLKRVFGEAYTFYKGHLDKDAGILLPSFKLAALFHDSGKPFSKVLTVDGKVKFPQHEIKSSEVFERSMSRYSFGKKIVSFTKFLIEKHIEPSHLFAAWRSGNLSEERIVDFFMDYGEGGVDLLLFALADTLAKGKISASSKGVYIDFLKFMAEKYYTKLKERLAISPLVRGDELAERLNMEIKSISPILRELKKAQILGRISNASEAFELARKFIASDVKAM